MLRSPTLDKTMSSSAPNIAGRLESTADAGDANVTIRDKRRRLSNEGYDELTAFKLEIRNMFEAFQQSQDKKFDTLSKNLQEVKAQTLTINSSSQDIEKSLDFMSTQLLNLQSKIDGLEGQRKEIATQINQVEDKCEFLEKSLKKTCIEIKFVPRVERENKDTLFTYIHNLARNLDITLHPSDLRDVYRVPNKKDPSKSTIITELSNTMIKSKFIDSARKFNKTRRLSVSHLGLENNTSAVFISETLTAKSRRLYFLAREYARQENFQYCWTSNGNVYLKKQEGTPYILVKNENQISLLSNK